MVQGVTIEDGCIVNKNPATGEVLSRVRCSTPEEIEKMIEEAKSALDGWSSKTAQERVNYLRIAMKEFAKDVEKVSELMVKEMGKIKEQAVEEMEGAVDRDEYFDLLLDAQETKKHGSSLVVREAIGVVVIMSPWNFPVDEILLLALPALAAGNTVVVKPSEVTPECGAAAVKALQATLPPNVVHLAQGDGVVGAKLVSHPLVDMVAMTGSSATGRKIMSEAGPKLKRAVLELGGKDPMVVFADADLEKAAEDAVTYSVYNAGQVCCSVERIYVEESVKDEFEKKVVEIAKGFTVGNGMDPETKVGPMVSTMQRHHVAKQVDAAIEDGAKLLLKSEVPEGTNFYPVTVLSDLTQEMDINRNETFGPVVALSFFDGTEAEAIRLANDTEYGLSGSVYTKDAEKGQRVAGKIQCGQVGVNCYALAEMSFKCPWVGHKGSGYGYHSGIEGFHQFSIPKTMVIGG